MTLRGNPHRPVFYANCVRRHASAGHAGLPILWRISDPGKAAPSKFENAAANPMIRNKDENHRCCFEKIETVNVPEFPNLAIGDGEEGR